MFCFQALLLFFYPVNTSIILLFKSFVCSLFFLFFVLIQKNSNSRVVISHVRDLSSQLRGQTAIFIITLSTT